MFDGSPSPSGPTLLTPMRVGLSLITAALLAVFLLPGVALAEPSNPLAPAEGEQVVIGEQPDGIRFWFTEPNADTYEIDVLVSTSPHVNQEGRLDEGIYATGSVFETPTPGYVSWTLERERYAPKDGGDVDMPPGVYYWQTDSLQCTIEDRCHVYGPVRSFELATVRTEAKPPPAPGTTGTSTSGERAPVGGGTPATGSGTKTGLTAAQIAATRKKAAAARKRAAAKKKAKRCRTLLRQKKYAKARRLGCRMPKPSRRAAKRS